jgi:asparagine synthase (glutamine-hydrolysing)
MNLFGYHGPFTAGHAGADILSYGTAVMQGSDKPTGSIAGHGALWSAETLVADGIGIALRGAPLWRSGSANEARATLSSIAAAYRQFGAAFLSNLAGSFGLALIDGANRRVLLAVDPMGIQRMTYSIVESGIVFGSSAEHVARCPIVNAGLNHQAIFDYLMMHMVPAPQTIFSGVEKLMPGAYLLFENGARTVKRYWSPTFHGRPVATESALREQLFDSLRAGVRAAQPDTATGAFLSGGLDSSTVAGILAEVGPKPAKTFSIGFGYADYDELSYARIANTHFGCKGHEHTIHGNDIVESFASIAKAYDEPFGNSSALPAYYCALLAKQNGVNHLLAGDGGDELFAGNSRYADQQVFERYQRVPKWFRQGLLEPSLRLWPQKLDFWPTRKARGYIDKANIPLPARLETWNIVHRIGAANMLHPDFIATVDVNGPFRRMQEVWDSTPSTNQLNRMLYYDWQYTLADNDLRKVETMCGLAGVTVSYPMLHHAVVDMSTGISPDVMMPNGQLRHFYKQATTGFLPDAIIHKKKHGFGLPFGLWLQESPQLRAIINGNLSDLRKRNIVRESFIDQLLGLHGAEDARYYGVFLWVLAMLEQWFKEHPTH